MGYWYELAERIDDGGIKRVKEFLDEYEYEVNLNDTDGESHNIPYLVIACKRNKYEIAELLIQRGADVNIRKSSEDIDEGDKLLTPLNFAISNNNEPLVRLLLMHKADGNDRDKFNLKLALRNNNLAIVEALFEYGFFVNDLEIKGFIEENYDDEINNKLQELIVNYRDEEYVKSVRIKRSQLKNELFKAILDEDIERLKELLEQRINGKNEYGQTPLIVACQIGNIEMVKALYEAQRGYASCGELNHIDMFGKTAFMYACERSKYGIGYNSLQKKLDTTFTAYDEIVRFLDDRPYGLIKLSQLYRKEIDDFLDAIRKDDLAKAKALIQALGFSDFVTSSGTTPLMIACSYGYTDMVKLILRFPCDINRKDSKGKTALDHVKDKYPAIADILKEYGANPFVEKDGITALSRAKEMG